MKKTLFLLLLLSQSVFSGTVPLFVYESSGYTDLNGVFHANNTNRLLEWGEYKFHSIMQHGTETQILDDGTQYRCYTPRNYDSICVGVKDDRVYTYSPITQEVNDIGSVDYYLAEAEKDDF